MIKLPINGQWTQPNNSDKFGSLAYTKNINLDEEGYIKLSPRAVSLFNDTADVTNIGSTDFDFPVAFGRYQEGSMRIATTDEPFNLTVTETEKSISEDNTTDNPNLEFPSHGVWWQNRWYVSTSLGGGSSSGVSYNASGTWTAVITGLTAAKRHVMEVFRNRKTLCVANGNVLKQYDTSHSASTDLTLPSDFEIIGLAYNNYRMGIITRLGSDSAGQNAECFFFSWDGATTEANQGVSLGSYSSFAIIPYKSSFVVINSAGQLLYWNGGGFDVMASFPFYYNKKQWGDTLNYLSYGDNMVVEGDVIYINVGFQLDQTGKSQEKSLPNNPAGVWCYDPVVGLYHKWSPSNSNSYLHTITQANVDVDTDILTTSVTIPATGNPMTLSSGTVGGLKSGIVYYVIKLSDTTFQIAETKEKALVGVYLDITSASANQYFWMYSLIDYGISYYEKSGAVALWGLANRSYQDIIFGGRHLDTDLTSVINLCTAVPFLENRGYFVTPKTFLGSVTDNYQTLYLKYRPLSLDDKIIVKVRTKNVLNLPSSSPRFDSTSLYWSSSNECYTTVDLSAVKTAFDAGNKLEIELTAGVGAGQMVQIESMAYESGTYSMVLKDDVIGASSGLQSHFSIDNWEEIFELNYDNQDDSGVWELPIDKASKWIQFKIELRGYETTIEDLLLTNTAQKT